MNLTRVDVLKGLSMAMTLQNVCSPTGLGGANLLSNNRLEGREIGSTWTNPENGYPMEVETVPDWYVNNGFVEVVQTGLYIERATMDYPEGYFMQIIDKANLELFIDKKCAVGAVVNGHLYTKKLWFLSSNNSLFADFGLFRIRLWNYPGTSYEFSAWTVDVIDNPIILSDVYWSLASENWPWGKR